MKKTTIILMMILSIILVIFVVWDLYLKNNSQNQALNNQNNNQSQQTVTVPSNNGSFLLTSDAGVDGGTLPIEYTCDGAGSSPALSWSGAPSGTKEYALMMTTPVGPGDVGTNKWNWVIYNIPADTASLAKNTTGAGTLGVGHTGSAAYEPPCSQGPGAKVYTFTIYALSASPNLPSVANQVTGEVLIESISSITLSSASLSLSYARSK